MNIFQKQDAEQMNVNHCFLYMYQSNSFYGFERMTTWYDEKDDAVLMKRCVFYWIPHIKKTGMVERRWTDGDVLCVLLYVS